SRSGTRSASPARCLSPPGSPVNGGPIWPKCSTWSSAAVAKIERVEVFMVDLVPKVKRVDAIQSFVSQETPFVRIFADDGAVGTGYTYTIGTGGPSVVELIARSLAPQLIGRDPDRVEEIWKSLFFHTHATAVGAITALALAAIDTALWDMRCHRSQRPLH